MSIKTAEQQIIIQNKVIGTLAIDGWAVTSLECDRQTDGHAAYS